MGKPVEAVEAVEGASSTDTGAPRRPRFAPPSDANPRGSPNVATIALVGYLATVLVLGAVHDVRLLLIGWAIALVAAGPRRWRLLGRSLRAVILFNAGVSIGYLVIASGQADPKPLFLLQLNLRVGLLVYLGFAFVERVNLLKAVAFSPTLTMLASIAAAQVAVVRRLVRDARLALISRGCGRPPRGRERLVQAAALSELLLDKAVANTEETTRALRSRGCFDD